MKTVGESLIATGDDDGTVKVIIISYVGRTHIHLFQIIMRVNHLLFKSNRCGI